MELFTVTRYTNDDQIEESHENKLLKKLLKKAKKRKFEIEDTKITSTKPVVDVDLVPVEHPILNLDKNQNVSKQDEIKINGIDDGTDFQVLGDDVFKKKLKITMVLPPWLAFPTIISTKISGESENEPLKDVKYISPIIKENLRKMGITKFFPVQKEVVPSILNAHAKPFPFKPRDICVSAPTGSGKTLAFGIPLVQLLMNRVERKIRALIILPVNELALQIFKVLKCLAEGTVLSIRLLSKSISFVKEQQLLIDCYKGQYYSKADIVVTTPGRLVEHLHSTKGFCLKNLKFLIIDEADHIMEQIHFNWLYHLDEHVRKTSDEFLSGTSTSLCLEELTANLANQPHKMLFSATLSHDPEKLVKLKLFQPKLFTTVAIPIEKLSQNLDSSTKETRGEFIGKYTTPSELTEKICLTEIATKPLTLFALSKENNWKKFLCFTNSVDSAYRLSKVLDYFFGKQNKICELSASLTPNARNSLLQKFAKGKITGLICSDALARGIDIPEVDIVISYDVPRHIKTYIHRIGRTARAGRPGTAITLLSEDEMKKFKNVLLDAGKIVTDEIKVNSKLEEQYANQYTKALSYLQYKMKQKKKREFVKSKLYKSVGTMPDVENDNTNTSFTALEKIQKQLNLSIESQYEKRAKNQVHIPRKFRKNPKKIKKNK